MTVCCGLSCPFSVPITKSPAGTKTSVLPSTQSMLEPSCGTVNLAGCASNAEVAVDVAVAAFVIGAVGKLQDANNPVSARLKPSTMDLRLIDSPALSSA